MEAPTRRCQQCGEIRDINQFRQYYNRNKTKEPGRYRICKVCEAINQRYKYIVNTKIPKGTATDEDLEMKDKIDEMYKTLDEAGRKVPKYGSRQTGPEGIKMDLISSITNNAAEKLKKREEAGIELDTPDTLAEWQTKDLTAYTPEELDKVYLRLRDKFAPVVGLDPTTSLPVRDEIYRETLDKILDRFNEYEDNY